VVQLTRRPEQQERTATAGARGRHAPLSVPLRVAIDVLLIGLGFWLAYLLRYEFEVGGNVEPDMIINGVFTPGDYRPFAKFLPILIMLVTILVVTCAVRGLYRLPRWTSLLDEAMLIISSALLGFSALIVVVFYYRTLYFSRLIFLFAFVLVVGLLILWRIAWHGTVSWMRARGRWVERVLVVGAGPAGERVMSALISQPALGYTLAGFVEDAPLAPDWAIATQRAVVRPEQLGGCHDLPEVIRNEAIDEVIITLPSTAHDQLYWVIEQCRACRVGFTLVPDLFELSLDRVTIHSLNGLPLIATQDGGLHGPNAAIKRSFDLVVGGIGLVVMALPMLVISLLIRLDSPGPALYGQKRVGRNGRTFTCYKFRSMHRNAHQDYERLSTSTQYTGDRVAFKMRDDPRRTRMGRWLRRTSLDELPNLLNVLRGEMSIIGPRPHVTEEVAKYEPWHRQRLAITPGMTCLWQVNGRSDLTFDEQVRFDLYYAERWSLWLDIKILLWTIPAVITRRGAY
jgi:exopolysaccharide biosynthesis polyprenyl glycosylphosphotransferase